jgi:glycosyltransferase involved in cell wall biosynthesis
MSTKPAAAPRVLMVLEAVFPATRGGAEAQVRLLGNEFRRLGLDVLVVAPVTPFLYNRYQASGGTVPLRDNVDGIPVRRIPHSRSRLLASAGLLLRLVTLLLREGRSASVIHAHIAHQMAAVCCLVGRLLGKPVIVKLTGAHELTSGILSDNRSPRVRLLRWAMRRASYYQATSQQLLDALLRAGFAPEKARLIPNAVDVGRFRPSSEPGTRGRGAGRVGIYVGRFEREKGIEPLLRAWGRAFSAGDGVSLHLVGDGRLKASLQGLAAELGLDGQVRFLGVSAEVERELHKADFAVLPSLNEGLSNALLEYMSAGLPVLGSRVSGTEDLVLPGRTGWLAEPGDVASLEGCLRTVAGTSDEALREMGRRARQSVVSYAGLESVTRQLLTLYGLDDRGMACAESRAR